MSDIGDIFPEFDPHIHVIARQEAGHIYPSIPGEPDYFYSMDVPLTAADASIKSLMDRYHASAMQALRETCGRLFLQKYLAEPKPNWPLESTRELARELLSLDYSPVMNHFLDRGLVCVSYSPAGGHAGFDSPLRDAFLFTFKTGTDVLAFSRASRSWASLSGQPMRCPGGCGSEIEALPADPEGEDPFNSSCPYSCKVRVGVWNKKVEEAKKK